MAFDPKRRKTHVVGNFDFAVQIFPPGSSSANELVLELPISAAKGFGTGKCNVIRHRTYGTSAAVTTPHPGIWNMQTASLEGNFLFDLKDLIYLQQWVNLAQGKQSTLFDPNLGSSGYFRDIHITPLAGPMEISLGSTVPVGGTFKAKNVIPVSFSISDFDHNAPAICTWTLEVDYEDFEIIAAV